LPADLACLCFAQVLPVKQVLPVFLAALAAAAPSLAWGLGLGFRAWEFGFRVTDIGAARLFVIRKEAWPFYRTISGVRLCWELEEPKGPKNALTETAVSLACG